jgi:hypothetical protein
VRHSHTAVLQNIVRAGMLGGGPDIGLYFNALIFV